MQGLGQGQGQGHGQLTLQLPRHQDAQDDLEQDSPAWISSDEFRMFHFKITLCSKRFNHDWNFCPYAHLGERACRRDPLRYAYTSITCPDMLQKGNCARGDGCSAAHSVFEFWLHPHRYRTEMCKVGAGCNRRICFFAHRPEELRPLPEHLANADGAAGGKYSLSAPTPEGKQQQQQQQRQAGQLKLLPDQQAGPQGSLNGQAGFSSSSSSSANTANLLMSSNGSIHSNSTSPSVAQEAGRLAATTAAATAAGRDLLQPQRDPVMALDAVSMNGAVQHSPQAFFTAAKGIVTSQLPPRVPQLTAAAAAGGPIGGLPGWQQQGVSMVGSASSHGLGLQDSQHMLLPLQQQQPQQQQQYRDLIVSDGLALQLQQLGLGDTYALGTTTGAVLHTHPVLMSASAAQTMQPGPLLTNQVLTPAWQQQQQQQQQAVLFAVQQQQQQQQLLLRPASAALVVSAAAPALISPQTGLAAAPNYQQQHMLLQGHGGMQGLVAVTSTPDQLCNRALLQQQQQQQLYLGQQYVGQHPGLLQQGQVSACTRTV